MDTLGIIFTVVLIIAAILAGMYFLGKYLQKKQNESQQLIDQNRQKITAYIIDKKKAKVTEANFPKSVMEQMPKRLKFFKMPLVKIKSGPQIMTMFCDKKAFEALPVKKQVQLQISGGYILGFSTGKKGEKKPEFEKKLTWREKFANKIQEWQSKANQPVKKNK